MFQFPRPELVILGIVGATAVIAFRKDIVTFLRERRKAKALANPDPSVGNGALKSESASNPSGNTGPRNPAAFFPDKPSLEDYLDYRSYAETLAGLISHKDTQTPLTIGLFGAWGSGKTTLMRMIEGALGKETDSKRFVFVRFDAWKYYKEDALWRAMLLRVLDALKPKTNGNSTDDLTSRIQRLEESLYRDVEWEEKGGLTIDWPKLVKAGAGGALKLSFSFVPGLATLVKAVEAAQSKLGEGEVVNDFTSVAEAFQRHMVTHHQSQLLHLEQFQIKFLDLVREYFGDQLLVIFVDDLDRCLPERAIEVLEAIKLFLDVEGCVFVLGIDQEVITRGLEAKYKESGLATNAQSLEFSRHYIEKLIQLPFYLPPIEAHEMQTYISLLNVAWPHADCAQVFAEGLSPNPRQIKRTINVFMLLWRLSQKRSNLGDAVTPLRLAKVVILQTAYPRVFDHLKSDPLLLKQLEGLCCEATAAGAKAQAADPVLVEAIKTPGLKKLFQLLITDQSATFASLQIDELSAFFSLARRAPLVTESFARHPGHRAQEGATPPANRILEQERPFQLRPPVRDFVGRNEPINRALTALRGALAIGVITGMAGTGKTEFALLLGERLREDFPDGQLFIDMQGNSEAPGDPADALAMCIRALSGRERDLPTELNALEVLYRSQLTDKRVLILLDNAANASQVTPLTPPKGSALLVTSRNAFILPGMVGVTLNPLNPDEALALFMKIAPGVPNEAAAEICALCGYLPPAVRAAASTLAATPDLDARDYRQQLSDAQKRIELLGIPGVDVSLEASFTLSYSRLSDQTASVFRKLAVFPDTFDAKAEEAICEDPDHLNLSELVKLSLVFYDHTKRRYFVHSLLSLFAQRRLEEIEGESARKKHATYYVGVLREADSRYSEGAQGLFEGLSIFDRERANINAGFEWSVARASSDPQAASICVEFAKYGLQILEIRKSPSARLKWFEHALKAAQQFGDLKDQLSPLLGLGAAYSKLGQTHEALDKYTQALPIAQQFKLQQMEALIQSNLGLKYRDLRNLEEAVQRFKEQFRISRELGDRRGESIALLNLGNISLVSGETEDAIRRYEDAMKISQEIGDLQTEGLVLGNLGRVYLMKRKAELAIAFCQRQLEIVERFGDRLSEAGARFNIALALQLKGEVEEARKFASVALQIYEQFNSPEASRVKRLLTKLTRRASSTQLDMPQGEAVQ